MKRILHFTNKPIFPISDGGCLAMHAIFKALLKHQEFEVFHLALSTHKHPFELRHYPANWVDNVPVDFHFIDTKTNAVDALVNLLKNKSYNLSRFESKSLKEKLKKRIVEDLYDLVIMESIYLAAFIPIFKHYNIPVIIRTHNVEAEVWQSLSVATNNPLRGWYYRKLANQLIVAEKNILSGVDGIIAISEEDLEKFKTLDIKTPAIVIPTVVNPSPVSGDYLSEDAYFLGAMDWAPNVEGVNWLCKEVLPLLKPNVKVHLAGRKLSCSQYVKHKHLVCHGEIENAGKFINTHGVCLIPIHSGGGIKIKLLENLAHGKPIITTSKGIQGVNVVHNREVLIADSPEQFASAINYLCSDEIKRKQLGESAKHFIAESYSENKINPKLIEFIQSFIS